MESSKTFSKQISKSVEDLSMLDSVERLKSEPPADCHEYRGKTQTSERKANNYNRPSYRTPATASRPSKPPPLLKSSTVLQGLGGPSTSARARSKVLTHQQSTELLSESLPSRKLQNMLEGEGILGSASSGLSGTGTDNLGMECSLCMEVFEDEGAMVPRNLQCGHTYCTGCLDQLFPPSKHAMSEIDCPKCQMATFVPARNVERLPKNFGLLEVLTSHSYSSDGRKVSFGTAGESPIHRINRGNEQQVFCQEHGDHLSSYCVKDGVLVCSSCLLYGTHKHHNCLMVNEAARINREKLLELNPEVFKQHKKMEDALGNVEEMTQRVQEIGGKVADSLDSHFDDLIQQVEKRRNKLKVEVMERTQLRVQALIEQSNDLQESVTNASVVYHSAANLLKSDDYALLKGVALALEQIEGVFINPPPTTPRANDDLLIEFSSGLCEDIVSQVEGYGNIKSDVGTVSGVYVQPHHDGMRISWDPHQYADNQGISYHLQMASGRDDYVNIYRGGNTKFTWKPELQHGVVYKFRVQVRTTEGVGNWSEPVEATKAAPAFHWHETWRSVKIDLSQDKLEASWSKGGVHNYWATFAGDTFFEVGQHYVEIEIVDLGKTKPGKKLAIGVIGCQRAKVSTVPWHDGKCAIGQWKEVPSWSFHPISGTLSSKSSEEKPYNGVKLQNGDRIGMLVDMDEQKLNYFCNGQDLGVAFENMGAVSLLPAVSIRDKIRVRLRFPPPPYSRRTIKLVHLSSAHQLFAH